MILGRWAMSFRRRDGLMGMSKLLSGKNAIIYGGAGGLGAGVARGFAGEGASVFLAGRTRDTLEAVASEITAQGGTAHCAVLDALDEQAVNAHVQAVVDQAGSVDVSFNLISRGDVQGTPLLEMDVADFLQPIHAGARSNFITARAAARQMAGQGSGVILMLTSGSGAVLKPSPQFSMGGTGPADAAIECFMHYLAAEVGPRGVRVAGLWTAGVFHADLMASLSMLQRGPTLQQLVDAAAFIASERGSGITASIVNVSSGVSAH
jgi:NAD(P)-dependent dehydrogenase (short-subunit alcohol dehydrogenase family)